MCRLEYTLAHLPHIRFSYRPGNERSVAVPRTDGRTHTPLHARIYRPAHIHYLPDGDALRDSRRQPTARVSGEEEEVYRGAAGAERRAGHGPRPVFRRYVPSLSSRLGAVAHRSAKRRGPQRRCGLCSVGLRGRSFAPADIRSVCRRLRYVGRENCATSTKMLSCFRVSENGASADAQICPRS